MTLIDKRHKCMIYVRSAVIKVFHVLLLQGKKRMRIVSGLLFQLESLVRQSRLIFGPIFLVQNGHD